MEIWKRNSWDALGAQMQLPPPKKRKPKQRIAMGKRGKNENTINEINHR